MDAWPIEEVWLRPVLTPLVCAAVPFATAWVLRAVLSDDARPAGAIVGAAQIGIGAALGVTALGPRLVGAPFGIGSVAFGVVCAGVAAGATAWALGRRRTSGSDDEAATFGRPPPAPPASGRGVAVVTGVAIALSLGAAAALAWTTTTIDEAGAPHAGTELARWRLRVHPWDPVAMLAAGWASRQRDELDRAVAQAREARRMGIDAAPALELEAEVLAARGRCDDARATFDRAIEARARRTFEEDPLAAPLTLGGYHLPPSLVRECDGLDALPRLDLTSP